VPQAVVLVNHEQVQVALCVRSAGHARRWAWAITRYCRLYLAERNWPTAVGLANGVPQAVVLINHEHV
jgi:hypothetical protein